MRNSIFFPPLRTIWHGLRELRRTTGWYLKRSFAKVDARIIRNYLNAGGERRLHLGCGKNKKSGWLNTDYFPTDPEIAHLDATKRFPVDDNSFDLVFSEHMIEHIPLEAGLHMLQECHRVLKSGGLIRLSTPDLRFLIELYGDEKTELQNTYVKWSTDRYGYGMGQYEDVYVINNFFRNWDHLFIFDEKALCDLLTRAGFVEPVRRRLNESPVAALTGLENDTRMPAGCLEMESLILEAKKPGGEGENDKCLNT